MDYLLLIAEFFLSKKIKSISILIIVPIIISVVLHYSINSDILNQQNYGELVTLLGILLGFTISLFAILLTASNSHINTSKLRLTNFVVFGKQLSIFDVVQTSIAYIIILECLFLLLNLVLPIFLVDQEVKKLFFVINIGAIVHIVLILLRSMLDFYFVLSQREKK